LVGTVVIAALPPTFWKPLQVKDETVNGMVARGVSEYELPCFVYLYTYAVRLAAESDPPEGAATHRLTAGLPL
jgi:hypothetical protein